MAREAKARDFFIKNRISLNEGGVDLQPGMASRAWKIPVRVSATRPKGIRPAGGMRGQIGPESPENGRTLRLLLNRQARKWPPGLLVSNENDAKTHSYWANDEVDPMKNHDRKRAILSRNEDYALPVLVPGAGGGLSPALREP